MLPCFERICISSTGGGGGKTLLSIGLGRALAKLNISVQPFKKGPDYIDAAWLALACGRPTTNLDPFFLDQGAIRALFIKTMATCEKETQKNPLALIEGNRGLYDGLDETGRCSTAVIARTLQCPILLCINAEKSTRTVAAILRGITAFEDGLRFCGVILNRVGSVRHETALRRCLEKYGAPPVFGALPRLAENPLPERHMGLASSGPELARDASQNIDALAGIIKENCDIPRIIEAARAAGPFPQTEPIKNEAPLALMSAKNKPFIGYVHDQALWFYYPENIQALIDAGANVIKLSLFDFGKENRENWRKISALYLGGGFPEDFAAQLSSSPLLKEAASMAENGMPVYAECGGLIALCKKINVKGAEWPMAGVFPQTIQWLPKPQGLGYAQGKVIAENPFFALNSLIRGHEFHYSHCLESAGKDSYGLELSRGKGIAAGPGSKAYDALLYKNVWAAYLHIFAPAIPAWARNFARAAKLRAAGEANLIAAEF